MPADPKHVHMTDQVIAYFGTLGAAYAAFVREARSGGLTKADAQQGAGAALYAWINSAINRPMDTPPPDGEEWRRRGP